MCKKQISEQENQDYHGSSTCKVCILNLEIRDLLKELTKLIKDSHNKDETNWMNSKEFIEE